MSSQNRIAVEAHGLRRGRILRDTNVGPGILVVDGMQHTFTLERLWRSDIPPRVGMTIDAFFDTEGILESVRAVSDAQVAKEQAQKALSGALRHGEAVGGAVRARFGATTIALEVLLLISFFALPAVAVNAGLGQQQWTCWEAIGMNIRQMATNDRGLLSLLAVVCLFAPVAVPFMQQTWARWLNAAPLVFCVIATAGMTLEIQRFFSEMTGAMGGLGGREAANEAAQQFSHLLSIRMGVYLVIVFAIALAWRARASRVQPPYEST